MGNCNFSFFKNIFYTKIVIKMFILFVIHMILDFYQISLNFFNKCCKNCFDLIKTIELSF